MISSVTVTGSNVAHTAVVKYLYQFLKKKMIRRFWCPPVLDNRFESSYKNMVQILIKIQRIMGAVSYDSLNKVDRLQDLIILSEETSSTCL